MSSTSTSAADGALIRLSVKGLVASNLENGSGGSDSDGDGESLAISALSFADSSTAALISTRCLLANYLGTQEVLDPSVRRPWGRLPACLSLQAGWKPAPRPTTACVLTQDILRET